MNKIYQAMTGDALHPANPDADRTVGYYVPDPSVSSEREKVTYYQSHKQWFADSYPPYW